jgi:tetratricopeptide (TPR) repeat protein
MLFNRQELWKWGVGLVTLVVIVLVAIFAKGGGQGGEWIVKEVDIDPVDRGLLERQIKLIESGIEAQESLTNDKRDWEWGLYRSLGYNHRLLGQLTGAQEAYGEYLEINPLNDAVWSEYAKVLEDMGELNAAEDAYMQALEIRPREQYVRDVIDFWRDNYPEESSDEIKELLETAIVEIGRTAYFMVELGQWYLAEGDCDQAIEHYEIVVDMLPDNESAQRNLVKVKEQCTAN